MPDNTTPTPPKRNHHYGPRGTYKTNRSQQIVDAALELFCYNGYDAVTNAMIEEASGISASVIYKHFGSKENLAQICASQASEAIMNEIASAQSEGITYEEQTVRTFQAVTKHRDAIRFVITLVCTPKNAHIAGGVWKRLMPEKMKKWESYREEAGGNTFDDILWMMTALHHFYVMNGDLDRFESARRTLLGFAGLQTMNGDK